MNVVKVDDVDFLVDGLPTVTDGTSLLVRVRQVTSTPALMDISMHAPEYQVSSEVNISGHDRRPSSYVVVRRLVQFQQLGLRLASQFPGAAVPTIPPDVGAEPASDVKLLAYFLEVIASSPLLRSSHLLWLFLSAPAPLLDVALECNKGGIESLKQGAAAAGRSLKAMLGMRRKSSTSSSASSSSFFGKRKLSTTQTSPEVRARCTALTMMQQQLDARHRIASQRAAAVSNAATATLSLYRVLEQTQWAYADMAALYHQIGYMFDDDAYSALRATEKGWVVPDSSLMARLTSSVKANYPCICETAEVSVDPLAVASPRCMRFRSAVGSHCKVPFPHIVVTPAATHRVRQLPTKASFQVGEVRPKEVVPISSIYTNKAGETWGCLHDGDGWTLLSDAEGVEYLQSMAGSALCRQFDRDAADEIPGSQASVVGKSLMVVGPSGKIRDAVIIAVSPTHLKIHYVGFPDRHNEWIEVNSPRILCLQESHPTLANGAVPLACNKVSEACRDNGSAIRAAVEQQPTLLDRCTLLADSTKGLVERSMGSVVRAMDEVESIVVHAGGIGAVVDTDHMDLIEQRVRDGVAGMGDEAERAGKRITADLGRTAVDLVKGQVAMHTEMVSAWESVLDFLISDSALPDPLPFNMAKSSPKASPTQAASPSVPPPSNCSSTADTVPPGPKSPLHGDNCNMLDEDVLTPSMARSQWSDTDAFSPLTAPAGTAVTAAGMCFEVDIFGDLVPMCPDPAASLATHRSTASSNSSARRYTTGGLPMTDRMMGGRYVTPRGAAADCSASVCDGASARSISAGPTAVTTPN